MISSDDVFLFNEGTHIRLYEKLGAHLANDGVRFAVWAPNARSVGVMGDFNGWNRSSHALSPVQSSGIWEGFVPNLGPGDVYKYAIESQSGYKVEKADPFGFGHEVPPKTASVVTDLSYAWRDAAWMSTRKKKSDLDAPISIYECHFGSFRRHGDGRPLSYREIAPYLIEHVREHGYTHIEFLPLMEHPFHGSWGYQVTGYFAPTSRYGSPTDLMWLIDELHANDIGVILDWVPAHFPTDEHGLGYFDGTHLFEHADPRKGFHPDWNTFIFNYDRHEVRSFLLSSAIFWLDRYHADGLRVDGVASMLYLDYSRKAGEWIPNEYGGRENLGALRFLRAMNEVVYGNYPGVQTYAEESTAWPMVSRPTSLGGLGFGYKWDMGWMHDTLHYMQHEPVHRKWHHGELTFRAIYMHHENYVLPLSHDEVVHGKRSLLDKMPGDEWQKRANLRLLYSYMWATPGKKLLFMGGDLGQWEEWNHESSVAWHRLEEAGGRSIASVVRDLNRLYRHEPALHERDYDGGGFEWIVGNDGENSVIAFTRYDARNRPLLAVCNFTPVVRHNYRVGVKLAGVWREVFNSDAAEYGGSGVGNAGRVEATPVAYHGKPLSLNLTLPPLGAIYFVPES
jgi:1,4-alpha-glucan branching enzyme